MNYLSNFFTMDYSPLGDGRPRYMGQSSGGLANLEIIGDKRDISSTYLMIGLPNDAPNLLAENTAILLRFLRNAIPEWPQSDKWVLNTIQTLIAQSNTEESTKFGHKKIKVSVIKELGFVGVSVRPIL